MHQKLTHCMQEILLKLRYYQKALKKLTLFFLLNSVSFNVQNYQKQKGSGTSDQLFFRLQNRFRKIPLSKNYICKFMPANSWHHKLFHFLLSFWICKVWKGREKMTKIWISREREIRIIFHSFYGLSFDEKIKNW